MPFAKDELKMWAKPVPGRKRRVSDEELEARYEQRGQKVVLETNREKLQNFFEALRRPGYMNIRPFYQRRPRWDSERQSRLIESFILNIPVPPLYLYETSLNSYEVIDGQQRIIAIQNFFSDKLRLQGLVHWPELDGRTYSTLPGQLRAGIERRSISYVVVLRESAEDEEEALFIKQTLFERLNTGGVRLSAQEIRNSLYDSPFNRLLRELAETSLFRQVWLPSLQAGRKARRSEEEFYSSMQDVEVILRFFALRHYEHFRGGIKQFLDIYMYRSRGFQAKTIKELGSLFLETLEFANELYQDRVFCAFSPESNAWGHRRLRAIADAVMIACSERLGDSQKLIERRQAVVKGTEELFRKHPKPDIIGRLNSATAVRARIKLFQKLLGRIVAAS